MRRKQKQEQQSSLPLPEVSQEAGTISLENAGLAHLQIFTLADKAAETLAAAQQASETPDQAGETPEAES